MEVVCNGQPCTVELCGAIVSCTPVCSGGALERDAFTCSEVKQLLRSRRDACTAKVVVDSRTLIMRFASMQDRERFIEDVQCASVKDDDSERWVASAICNAAVDTGILSEGELELFMKEECPRGVATVFDAIGSLVDPVTFKLRPITEQMTNDIFRQIPVLAKIFSLHVTDEETMARFWEAVVKKYFCFSRTFLEEEIRDLEGGEVSSDITLPSGGGEDTLQGINRISGHALPKVTPHTPRSTDATEAGVRHTAIPLARHHLFRGRFLPASSARRWQCEVQPCMSFAKVRHPPAVSKVMPKENTSKEVLEVLKKFWGGDRNQRRALRAKLESLKEVCGNGVLQRACLERTAEFLSETGDAGGASSV
uniref:Uncharacterized protein TCIL3000_11_9850 n=1 Tax=Trypanosoma congolense (strain IL3000) TaxID=1068625 RepID=G0V1J7_TRYCI|nr:unnamed protein product [Trypanosoma congolense IL3000]